MNMAKIKELHLNDDVALAGHTHTAAEVSYNGSSTYSNGTVGAELKTLGSSKVSNIQSDPSIAVDTTSQGTSVASPKISVVISGEGDNGLRLKGSTETHPGLYVSKETLGPSSVYIPQGNIDISGASGSTDAEKQRNAAATLLADTVNVEPGFVYNIPYDGTIAESAASGAPDITVKVGDNIAVVEVGGVRKWDKLSATINATYSGGDGIAVNETNRSIAVDIIDGNGLAFGPDGSGHGKLKVVLADGGGLNFSSSSGGIYVEADSGIAVGSSGVSVKTGKGLYIDTNDNNSVAVGEGTGINVGTDTVGVRYADGLTVNGCNALAVSTGDGITTDTNGRVKINLAATNSGLALVGGSGSTSGDNKLAIDLADSNPGLSIDSTGIKVNGADGIAVSGSSVVLHRRTATSGNNTVDNSGLAISANAVYVNAGAGLELSGSTETSPGSVRVKLSTTTGKQNINNNDGTYVSLNRAFGITSSTEYIDDTNHNPTIGDILASLGANLAPVEP